MEIFSHGAYGRIYRKDDRVFKKAKDLRSEYQILKDLDHMNVVKVFSLEVYNDGMVMSMESMDIDLRDIYIKEQERSCRWLCQIAKAIDFLHEHGIVHRDIKPDNILINRDRTVAKLCDFGFAYRVDMFDGQRLGTELYMAPEVHANYPSYDNRIDIWSFGSLLYEFWEMGPPFMSNQRFNVRLLAKSPPFQETPEHLRSFLRKALALYPDHRPTTAYRADVFDQNCQNCEVCRTPSAKRALFGEDVESRTEVC